MAKILAKNYPGGTATAMPRKVGAKIFNTERYRAQANRGYHVNQVIPKALPVKPIPSN